MTPEPTDLMRAIVALERGCTDCGRPPATDAHWKHEGGCECAECLAVCWGKGGCQPTNWRADAARLLREMAADFEEYGHHDSPMETCDKRRYPRNGTCDCGLDAARAKWRLP